MAAYIELSGNCSMKLRQKISSVMAIDFEDTHIYCLSTSKMSLYDVLIVSNLSIYFGLIPRLRVVWMVDLTSF